MPQPKKPRVTLPSGWALKKLTPRMTKPCDGCSEPIVGKNRVRRILKTRPFPTQNFFCIACAVSLMNAEVDVCREKINNLVVRHAEGDV